MANASSWTKGHPSGTSLLRDFDDLYRSDKSVLEASMLEEHYWKDGSAASAGRHKRGSARVHVGTASQVSVVSDDGRLMWATDQNRLYYLSSVSTLAQPSLSTVNTWVGVQSFSTKAQLEGGARLPDGSSAAPSLQIGQDTLGLYRAGTDILAVSKKLQTPASDSTQAGFRLPHGTAPSVPVNGDLWSTTTGVFAYVNGSVVVLG